MPADRPRFLHRHSAHGYTDRVALSMFAEGEAVSAEYQEQITAAAHQTAHDVQVEQWREARAGIERRVDWLYSQRFRRDVSTQLRALQRQLKRIDQRIVGGG